jgi:hypothetical protein
MKLHNMMGGIPHGTIIGTAHFLLQSILASNAITGLSIGFLFLLSRHVFHFTNEWTFVLSPATMAPNFHDHNDTIFG